MSIRLEDYNKKPESYTQHVNRNMVIEAMVVKTAREVFGESAKNPDKNVLVMMDEHGVSVNLSLAKGLSYSLDDDEFMVDDVMAYERAINNSLSKWAAFVSKYGIPRIGLEIKLVLNDNLYYEIML